MGKGIRILLVDDHEVVRSGLRDMLEQEDDFEIVGQCANSAETLSQIETLSPHVVLMDIKMPGMDGIQLTRLVKQKYSSCEIIMLTLYDEYLTQAIEAGAMGYLLKDINHEELADSIRQVHHGEMVISRNITPKIRMEYEEKHGGKEDGSADMLEELQLVVAPPVEANQLMRFANHVEEMLQSRVLQVVGSWQEGTIITTVFAKAMSLAYILKQLGEMSEIATIREQPIEGEFGPNLFKKISVLPRLKNRPQKTIFVTLGGN